MNVSVVGIAAVLTGGGAADVAPPTTIQTRFRRVFQRKRYHHARRACFSSVDCLCFARPLSCLIMALASTPDRTTTRTRRLGLVPRASLTDALRTHVLVVRGSPWRCGARWNASRAWRRARTGRRASPRRPPRRPPRRSRAAISPPRAVRPMFRDRRRTRRRRRTARARTSRGASRPSPRTDTRDGRTPPGKARVASTPRQPMLRRMPTPPQRHPSPPACFRGATRWRPTRARCGTARTYPCTA